ncbi:MAG: TIM barrel protein [Verrucomicrobia bacterium]|nr:TIM barrel protein [Verrucomicrobiota bacterium]
MSIKVANAPCSWGILEFELAGEAAGYSQVLDEIRETGYLGTELGDWGFMPTDPESLKRELQSRNLDLVGAFVPVSFSNEAAHSEGEARALKTARLMTQAAGSSPFIILADENGKEPARTQNAGRVRPEHGLSQNQWATYGKGVNRVAETILRETGLRTVFHHHCAGYVETPEEIDAFLRQTDPKTVGLCFDTGHYRYGGGDPSDGFRRFKNRIWHVHFKDCSAAVRESATKHSWDYFEALKHGVFCELGKGDVDFNDIVTELGDIAYSGWIVVEQDVLPGMGSPKDCAKRNRDFLRSCNL